MGRTQRKRRHKIPQTFKVCSKQDEIISLHSWLRRNGIIHNEKLTLAVFNETGRGVLATKKIASGEELVNLPLNTTINVISIMSDKLFCSIFLQNKIKCISVFKQSISFQSLMSFYLMFLKIQGNSSKWFIYIQSLPKEYTVPYFLPNEVRIDIHPDINAITDKQREQIFKSYKIFDEVLQGTTCKDLHINELRTHFKLTDYEWAYFTVNTRCVFMDLSIVIDLKNIEDSILNIVFDNTKISLCPYLDMINHSPNAKNETKLVLPRDIEKFNVLSLNENLFSDVQFSIYTKNRFDAYNEVFICYGDSHNLKLVTEYGFFIPNNDLDFVPFQYDFIIEFLSSKSIKLSHDQVAFINSHGLNKDLYIDFRGLSFNFYGLLMVVEYFYKSNMDVSKLIYSAAICSNDKLINDLITPMITKIISDIKISVDKLKGLSEHSIILDNCISLMCQYVSILEKFIDC